MLIKSTAVLALLFKLPQVLCVNEMAKYNCGKCLTSGGNFCLKNKSFDTGLCCDPKSKVVTADCKSQDLQTVCASETTIKSAILQQFVCPLDNKKCPSSTSEVYVELNGKDT